MPVSIRDSIRKPVSKKERGSSDPLFFMGQEDEKTGSKVIKYVEGLLSQ